MEGTSQYPMELPPELNHRILNFLSPLQMVGFARTSHAALDLTHFNLTLRLVGLLRQQDTRSETGRYMQYFRNMFRKNQSALMGTLCLLPAPGNLVGDLRMDAYLRTFSACQHATRGNLDEFEHEARLAKAAAVESGLPEPNFDEARVRACWAVTVNGHLNWAHKSVGEGFLDEFEREAGLAIAAAAQGGLPEPDFDELRRRYLDVRHRKIERPARGTAERCCLDTSEDVGVQENAAGPKHAEIRGLSLNQVAAGQNCPLRAAMDLDLLSTHHRRESAAPGGPPRDLWWRRPDVLYELSDAMSLGPPPVAVAPLTLLARVALPSMDATTPEEAVSPWPHKEIVC